VAVNAVAKVIEEAIVVVAAIVVDAGIGAVIGAATAVDAGILAVIGEAAIATDSR
jgi:thiazole synthase ThiGH ThiG subunit